jgi:hypothetical protein
MISKTARSAALPEPAPPHHRPKEDAIMPRPPILPTLDWRAIFKSGLAYNAWLRQGENPENVRKMKDERAGLVLEDHQAAALAALPRAVHVIAIAEDWCGDVVRHVPVLQLLADDAPRLRVRYISRQQHPDVFARFLTNGGEAIPKFIFLSSAWVECGHWGPMSADCRELISRGKALGDVKTARERVSARYAADPARREVIRELMALIDIAATTTL